MVYRRGLLTDDEGATSDAQPGDVLGRALPGLAPVRDASGDDEAVGGQPAVHTDRVNTALALLEAEALERSTESHEREARLHDRLAAQASGYLHLANLHAAEAHRAAAQGARASAAATRRNEQTA